MKIGIIVQARMNSQRFPGKVLYPIAGKSLLQYLIERLERCSVLGTLVVATSIDTSDMQIVRFCQERGLECYQGPLVDVAGRFREVLESYQFGGFIRISGDSPLLDQRIVEQAVTTFLASDFDLVTNVFPRTYPLGQSVEVLRSETFRRVYQQMQDIEDREHVTQFFYRHPQDFRIHNFTSGGDYSSIRLCVDTEQDIAVLSKIVARMSKPHWQYHLQEIIQIYQEITRG